MSEKYIRDPRELPQMGDRLIFNGAGESIAVVGVDVGCPIIICYLDGDDCPHVTLEKWREIAKTPEYLNRGK